MSTRLTTLTRFAKSTYTILALTMVMSLATGLAYAALPEPDEPKAVINPQSSEYIYTASPVFDIETGSNKYYKVELALARKLFSSTADRKTSGETRNFYESNWEICGDTLNIMAAGGDENCETTFMVNKNVWENLRGSVVFYRVITNSSQSEIGALKSVPDGKWNDLTYNWPSLKRIGETWYGLPLNDKAQVLDKAENKNIYVVENGKLKGTAINSDFGPRNVDSGTRFHPGLDISVVKGTPIYAIADGKVVHLPDTGSMGRLNIKHLEGTTEEYLSGYVHLDKAVVSLNEEVKAGQLIAYSGNKGTIGYHLHFEAGFTDNDKYHNPLHYISHTDEHIIKANASTFLADSNTNGNLIDVRNAVGDQDKVLIGFGVTTNFDKDLNYVSVQVDQRIEDGWYFLLNYDDVKNDPKTGTVELNNGKKFEIKKVDYNIYGETNLTSLFYVKAAETDTGLEAKDYFFFPWDVSSLKNIEDGGPHIIEVKVGEVDNSPVGWSLTIGPEVFPTDMKLVDERTLTYDLMVFNYDIPENNNGIIQLKVEGLPSGWSASFSEANPSIGVGQNKKITLTLTTPSPQMISSDEMRDNNTRVVATFGRIQALKDSWVFCPSNVEVETMAAAAVGSDWIVASDEFCPTDSAKVTILKPTDNSNVPANKVYKVEVSAPGAASDATASLDVEDLTNGSSMTLNKFSRKVDTFTFDWTPSEVNHEYGLTATVSGFNNPSSTVTVTAVNDEVIFIYPTHNSKVEGGKEMTVIVDAPYGATNVVLEIYPTNPSAGGEMTKAADGTWQYSGWVPSKDVEYYNLTATAYENGSQLAYNFIRVEPIPDQATIEVQEPVKVGDEKTVTVKAKDAFSVYLTANGVQLLERSHNNTEWKFTWRPTAGGNYLLYAVVHYNNGGFQYPERTVEVIDEGQNMIIVTIDDPQNGAVVYVGDQITIIVSSPGELKKVLLEITDEDNNVEEKTVTSEDVGGYFMSIGIPWKPAKEGKYNIKAYAWSTESYKGWTDSPTVVHAKDKKPEDIGIWTPINEYARLWKNKDPILANFEEANYFNDWTPKLFDTMIPYSEYFCGVVGIAAHGGDIGEKGDNQYDQIIQIYADSRYSSSQGTWHLMIDFYTWNETGTIFKKYVDRKETWDLQLLCINRSVISLESSQPGKPVFFSKPFTGLGDNVGANSDVSTDIDHSEYVCGIIGFDSNAGDIQEFDDGDIILNYLFRKNNTWNIRAEFRTHSGFHENWDIKVFCIHRDWATTDNPQAGKPFVLKEYTNLGDNITYSTEFDVDEWACGVVGFAARDGDIDENNQGSNTNLILAYMQEGTEKWHIRADFRTHHDDESWDVNVLCMHKDLSAAPQGLRAAPTLFTTRDDNGVLYGPGMALKWEETYHPEAKYYEIQFSEDGGATWQILDDQRPIDLGGWRNHHGGNVTCGHGFGRCLKRNQTYSYRVRVLDSAKDPLTGWSDVVSAKSMEWPAHVELDVPNPPGDPQGYYPSGATIEIKIDPQETFGKDLELSWQIIPFSTSTYTILDNTCTTGSLQNSKATTCKLRINRGSSNVSQTEGTSKLAALEPVPSVKVIVKGEHTLKDQDDIEMHFSAWDDVYLYFQRGGDPDTTFSDVPEEHWAYPYITYLYDQGFVSGCSITGESKFCPEDPISREQQAVILVRAEHPEEPGYIPTEVEPAVVPFIDVQDKMAVEAMEGSTTAPTSYWAGKWIAELFDLNLTAGCSKDPPQYCPDMPVTRAQMAVFTVKLHMGQDFKPGDPPYQPFNDVALYDENGEVTWQARWIMVAKSNGLVQNCGADMERMLFFPEEEATRADMACTVYHALTYEWNDIVPPS